jgi:hypothetical protein
MNTLRPCGFPFWPSMRIRLSRCAITAREQIFVDDVERDGS